MDRVSDLSLGITYEKLICIKVLERPVPKATG